MFFNEDHSNQSQKWNQVQRRFVEQKQNLAAGLSITKFVTIVALDWSWFCNLSQTLMLISLASHVSETKARAELILGCG